MSVRLTVIISLISSACSKLPLGYFDHVNRTRSLEDAKFSNFPVEYLNLVTRKYFLRESVMLVYWSNVSVNLTQQFLEYWMTFQLITLECCVVDRGAPKVSIFKKAVKNMVLMLGNWIPDRDQIRKLLKCQNWNNRGKILVVLQSEEEDEARIILERFWTFMKTLNVTVMLIAGTFVRFFTFFPYGRSKIEQVSENLFPNKIPKKLDGNVLKIATTVSEPFILEPKKEEEFTDGIEIRIMKTISEHLGFGIKYEGPPNGEDPWVSKSKDGKIIGLLGVLDRQEADVLFHGMRIRPDRTSVGDIFMVHTFDNLQWAVPRNSYEIDWKSLFIMFESEVWIAVFVFLFLISLAVYFLTIPYSHYNLVDAFFQVLAQTFLVTIRYYRSNQLYRIFMFTFTYYALIVATLYQSSLVTFLTTPRAGKQFESLREVVDAGLTCYLYPGGKVYNLSDHDTWNIILKPGRHVWSSNYTENLRLTGIKKTGFTLDRVVVVEFEMMKSLLDDDGNPLIHILPEVVTGYWVAMFTSRGHPLKDLLYVEAMRLMDSGIIGFWTEDLKRRSHKTSRRKMGGGGGGPVRLSLNHLKGTFQMYFAFILLSAVVLACEKIWEGFRTKYLKIAGAETMMLRRPANLLEMDELNDVSDYMKVNRFRKLSDLIEGVKSLENNKRKYSIINFDEDEI